MHVDHQPSKPTIPAPRLAIGENVARTMSSREMSELTGKRHDSVKRTIETLAFKTDKNGDPAPVIGVPQIVEYLDTLGRSANEYHVSKRDSFVVVAQLCPEFTAKLVDRWQELETQAAKPAIFIPQTLPDALRLAADLAEQNNRLQVVVSEQAPKVEALARIADASGSMCLTDAAKHLGVQRSRLIEWMRANRWIYRREGCARWLAYQPRQAAGLLDHKVTVIGLDDDGDQRLASQVRVTPKGLAKLAQAIGGGL